MSLSSVSSIASPYVPTALGCPVYAVGSSPAPAAVARTSKWQCAKGGLARAALPELPITALKELPLSEGRSLQILHVGTYDDEAPTLARLHDEIMPGLGLTWNGPHHEIYLSDPRRVAPEKMKTALRQPVKPDSDSDEAD